MFHKTSGHLLEVRVQQNGELPHGHTLLFTYPPHHIRNQVAMTQYYEECKWENELILYQFIPLMLCHQLPSVPSMEKFQTLGKRWPTWRSEL